MGEKGDRLLFRPGPQRQHAAALSFGKVACPLFLLLLGCPKRVEPAAGADLTKNFAGGSVITQGGPKKYPGSEVLVEVRFKDGSPNCVMRGAVQYSRDDTHRWVWLEPTEGCPEWLQGRWWAELASGGTGWYVQDISTQAVEEGR